MGALGKLTRLPFLKKEELHRRLHDEQPGRVILEWINSDAEVKGMLEAYFDGKAVTASNLSDYKASAGFQMWKKKREELQVEQEITDFVVSFSHEAGLELTDAGAAIAASKAIQTMRNVDTSDPKSVSGMVKALASLQDSGVSRRSLALREKGEVRADRKVTIEERKVGMAERDREMNTVASFIKWARKPEAQAILASGKPQHVQMDLLHDLMFGKRPAAGGA